MVMVIQGVELRKPNRIGQHELDEAKVLQAWARLLNDFGVFHEQKMGTPQGLLEAQVDLI